MIMDYMERALLLAESALGKVSPNPAVGAVIVNNGKIIGQGATQEPGSDHAEIVALKQAGVAARGGVMYVTLEPCCHYGRTPPCTRAIIAAGIAELHMATLDVNSKVAGKGKQELEAAGLRVHLGAHEAQAKQVIEAYAKFITRGVPSVTAKFAMSLDGKIATRSGDSRWISGEASRQRVHRLRYTADAVMVGVGTVIADNPRLTARGQDGALLKAPLRVVVDSRGRTPPGAAVFGEPGSVLLASGGSLAPEVRQVLAGSGAEILELPSPEGRVDLKALVTALGARGITSVLVEGGGALLGALFDQRLVDKVIAFVAPLIIGGQDAGTAVAGVGVETIREALRLERLSWERFEDDIMIIGYPGVR